MVVAYAMFFASIPPDQEWSPSQRGSTSCSPPATTSTNPPARPRDDSCLGQTTGGPSWTARGSEDTPVYESSIITAPVCVCVCVCVQARRKRLSQDVRIYYFKSRKVKKKKRRRERLVISQIHNSIQGGYTKQTLVALCWEGTFTCLTARGRSDTEGEDVNNPHLHHFHCKTVTTEQLTTRTKQRAD